MPTPDPHVPGLVVTIATTVFYLVAVVAVLVPSIVALWVKFVDMPRLRATNHSIANSATVTSLQATANAAKLDTLTDGLLTAVQKLSEAPHASNAPDNSSAGHNATVRSNGVSG